MQNKKQALRRNKSVSSHLSEDFIARVHSYKNKLKRVETMTIEQAISSFEKDLLPERELVVWEQIAEKYIEGCKSNPNWNFDDKKRYIKSVFEQSLGING